MHSVPKVNISTHACDLICKVDLRCFERHMGRRSLEDHLVRTRGGRQTFEMGCSLLLRVAQGGYRVRGRYLRMEGADRTSVQLTEALDK